jgi:hypothetical protein
VAAPPAARFARGAARAGWRRASVGYRLRSAALAAERRSVRQPRRHLSLEEKSWLLGAAAQRRWVSVACRRAAAGSAGRWCARAFCSLHPAPRIAPGVKGPASPHGSVWGAPLRRSCPLSSSSAARAAWSRGLGRSFHLAVSGTSLEPGVHAAGGRARWLPNQAVAADRPRRRRAGRSSAAARPGAGMPAAAARYSGGSRRAAAEPLAVRRRK